MRGKISYPTLLSGTNLWGPPPDIHRSGHFSADNAVVDGWNVNAHCDALYQAGHSTLSPHMWVNHAIGYTLHCLVLVPYYGWRYSHNMHRTSKHSPLRPFPPSVSVLTNWCDGLSLVQTLQTRQLILSSVTRISARPLVPIGVFRPRKRLINLNTLKS